MSDQINEPAEETKPGDVVGTDKEFKRVENTLPEQRSAKGLQPIISSPTGNVKVGKTIGQMTGRKEKVIQDIQSIGQTPKKESNDIVPSPQRQEKEDPTLKESSDRKHKDDIDVSTSFDRSIKHKELERDIQRISQKRDADIQAQENHEQKREENVDTPQAQARKVEMQLRERSHVGKQEMNIFQNIEHHKKADVELEDKDTEQIKKEVETSISSSGLKKQEIDTTPKDPGIEKQEIDTGIKDPGLSKQEQDVTPYEQHEKKSEYEYGPKVTQKKQEVDVLVQDSKTEKGEVETPVSSSLGTPKNSNEKEISDAGNRNDKDYASTTGDENFPNLNQTSKEYNTTLGEDNISPNKQEKEWEQTTGSEDFPSLQKEEKTPNFNTTTIEKGSTRDFDPDRNVKAGIDGITAESDLDIDSTQIVSNYSFTKPPTSSNKESEGQRKYTKLNNLEYTDVMDAFTDALNTSIKEGDESGTEDLSDHTLSDISTKSFEQKESDHTISNLTGLPRSKKTQDTIFVEPDNIPSEAHGDKSDLQTTTIVSADVTPSYRDNYNERDLGPIAREDKGTNELPGGDPTTPNPQTTKPKKTIDWSDADNIRGINIATLAALARPVGNIKRLLGNNGVGNGGDVIINSLMPIANEGGAINGDMAIASDIFKGSPAVIPTTPDNFGGMQAGTTADDLSNYARHGAIQAFRVLANNVIDQAWTMGTVDSSDSEEAKKNVPGGKKSAEIAEAMAKATTIPDVVPASTSQSLRGQIAADSGRITPYSTKPITKSPAHVYKSFKEYISALRNQIAGNKILSGLMSQGKPIDEDLADRSEKVSRGNTDEQAKQMDRMVSQLINFETKLKNEWYESGDKIFDSQGRVLQGKDYSTWSNNQRRTRGSFKFSDFGAEESWQGVNFVDTEINGDKYPISKEFATSSQGRETWSELQWGIKEDGTIAQDPNAAFRTIIFNNWDEGSGQANGFDSSLLPIVDSYGEDFRGYFMRTFTHNDNMQSVYKSDNYVISGQTFGGINTDSKGKSIDIAQSVMDEYSDPHMLSALVPNGVHGADLNDGEKYFTISDRSAKQNFKEMLLADSNLSDLTISFDSLDNLNLMRQHAASKEADWDNAIVHSNYFTVGSGEEEKTFSELIIDELNTEDSEYLKTVTRKNIFTGENYTRVIPMVKDIYAKHFALSDNQVGDLVDDKAASLLDRVLLKSLYKKYRTNVEAVDPELETQIQEAINEGNIPSTISELTITVDGEEKTIQEIYQNESESLVLSYFDIDKNGEIHEKARPLIKDTYAKYVFGNDQIGVNRVYDPSDLILNLTNKGALGNYIYNSDGTKLEADQRLSQYDTIASDRAQILSSIIPPLVDINGATDSIRNYYRDEGSQRRILNNPGPKDVMWDYLNPNSDLTRVNEQTTLLTTGLTKEFPSDLAIVTSTTDGNSTEYLYKRNSIVNDENSNRVSHSSNGFDLKSTVINPLRNDENLDTDVIHSAKKKAIEITSLVDGKGSDGQSITEIMGGTITRHDFNNPDADWKSALKDKMNHALGSIIVNPSPQIEFKTRDQWMKDVSQWRVEQTTPSVAKTLYQIPFQFNPELTSESRQASWSSHTGYGRTNEFFVWNNTSSRQINFKTVYIGTDGMGTDKDKFVASAQAAEESEDAKDGTNYQYDDMTWLKDGSDPLQKNELYNQFRGGFGGWTPAYIHRIIQKYRSLVLPMDMSTSNLSVPPVLVIDFNSMFTRYTKSGSGRLAKWIVEDIGIEPIIELGFTKNHFPFGFEVSLTLKEIPNDWGDYEDIKTSYLDNPYEYAAQRS